MGMGVAELGRLKQLEEENRKLKKIVADLTLDKHMLQDVLIFVSLVSILCMHSRPFFL
jgi:hypothetical protein